MLGRTLLATAVLIVSAHADFDRTLTVAPQVDLYVATSSGGIHIHPGSDSEIHVRAQVRAGWNGGVGISRIESGRSARIPPIRQTGNEVHIGDVPANERRLYNNISIEYDITAPKNVALNLRTGSGDVTTDNLGRFLRVDTGSGSVRAHGIAGSADLHTGSGDVELQQVGAGEVRVSTGSGSIRINGLSGALNARTGSGDIEANGSITGASKLQSGSGSIRAHVGKDSRLNVDVSTGSGSIRIAGNRPPDRDRHSFSAPLNGGGRIARSTYRFGRCGDRLEDIA